MTDDGTVAGDALRGDVAVIGDGPAGSALAAALRRHGIDAVLVGPDEPWTATYTTWADDVDGLDLLAGADVWAHRFGRITVRFGRTHEVERPYGVFDNELLRRHLRSGVRHVTATIDDASVVGARLVVDATGWPSKISGPTGSASGEEPAWQTAIGIVLPAPPPGALGVPTMMDFSDPGATIVGRATVPTFAYSLPVAGGWLVEETVLSASPPVDPEALLPVLAARLDTSVGELIDAAVSIERVRIPMGAQPPGRSESGPVRYGASAGMIHPATGYSIASALSGADRVATAIADQIARTDPTEPIDPAPIRRAVWPDPLRRSRHLHDYGHDVLTGLDRNGIQRFFDAFFDLPVDTWSPYMRIDTQPRRLAAVMVRM
ncbi:MAG: lycopene cyclase family protein, partial [Ilumatobacter sp.]